MLEEKIECIVFLSTRLSDFFGPVYNFNSISGICFRVRAWPNRLIDNSAQITNISNITIISHWIFD